MTGCVPPTSGFISSMTGAIDCQAQVLGSGAWQVLATPGSTLLTLLTGFLTIFMALIGYNLLFGTTMTVRSATVSFVKIGAVFALATSWPAYRTLVYDLMLDGPTQLVAEIGPRAGVVGSDGTLLQRLDLTDQRLTQLAILGPGIPPPTQYEEVPPPFGGFDAFALGGARITFLITAIGGLAIVRIITGLMLGLGPFFIAFLLFDGTRGLFEGWIRVLAGAALASIGASIAIGLELAFIEPWLSDVLTRRIAGEALPTMPTELFVLALLFSILVLAALYACARVASGFRLPSVLKPGRSGQFDRALQVWPDDVRRSDRRIAQSERTRAAAIASIISHAGERDAGLALTASRSSSLSPAADVRASGIDAERTAAPVGRSFSRRPTARVSERASKRDLGQ
jgi:type IV secretion system protein VirB6